jgi:hypothetical protein
LWAGMVNKEVYKKGAFYFKNRCLSNYDLPRQKNRVVKVHSGFSGYATDEYDSFKQNLNQK